MALPLDALVTVYGEALATVHADLTERLRQRAEEMSERALAALLNTSQATLHRWLMHAVPEDAAALAAIRKRILSPSARLKRAFRKGRRSG